MVIQGDFLNFLHNEVFMLDKELNAGGLHKILLQLSSQNMMVIRDNLMLLYELSSKKWDPKPLAEISSLYYMAKPFKHIERLLCKLFFHV